jgi:Trypsin-like peptidase domain
MMDYSQTSVPRIGRILTAKERTARMAAETAKAVDPEVLRSAFAISDRFILTALHCVQDSLAISEELWFRIRSDESGSRNYNYVPVRVTNYDESFDVAVLAVDDSRIAEAGLSPVMTAGILAAATIPLGVDVRAKDETLVLGFPENATRADSDTNTATVVDPRLPLGEVTGIKLFGNAFAAVSPVIPHGLSGGPVLRACQPSEQHTFVAVGVVRAVPSGDIPGVAAGGCIIATHIEDAADRLPEVARALSAVRPTRASPQLLALTRSINVEAAFRACGHSLRRSLVEANDPDLGTLVGWPHFSNEPRPHRRPTAIGTAYGLKLSFVLGDQDHGLDRSALVETLWKLRRRDGGWAARTGTGIGRPEVSALVIGALATSGYQKAGLAQASAALEDGLSADLDPVAMDRTYVVSAIARGLVRAHPQSVRIAELRAALLAGVITDPAHGDLQCWSNRLSPADNQALAPSTAHTAQAIVALLRAEHVLGEDAQSQATVSQAVRWLASNRRLEHQTEQIRRFVEDNEPWDTLTVRHFTAAWVARALLLAAPTDVPEADTLLIDAVRRVWQDYRDGYWEWDDNERPIWMTYQGACVLRHFGIRTSGPL